jgi:CRP-like cAMP-binding protein
MHTSNVTGMADLELFADCTKTELRQIRSLMTHLRVPKDRVLIREGAMANEFIVIGEGTARVSRQTGHGVATLADVGTSDFLGEMALLMGTRRTATATATTDLTVFVSSASEFRGILRIAPSVAEKVVSTSMVRASSLDIAA